MVKYKPNSLDSVFSALADPTRRAILECLTAGELSVGQLAEPFDISMPAISKHLRVLEHAGLLVQEKDGRIRRCHIETEPLKAASDWLEQYSQFWEARFDALATFLQETQSDPTQGDQNDKNSSKA